ncbi:phosphotransferase [Propioniciclava coleopterorum]|uniref:Phosphotransferase n=1 Tax=Propioniciclava coleopterorum TaxID=2714937 RepID=A0A6G7Y372_9ACTN|nr:phosphotransferase [Propioniciclava coleopterorum]
MRTSIRRSAHLLDADAATATWERALRAAPLAGPPRTIHGDPVPGNLVIRDGRLAGLIDIAVPQIGDPASDLAPAWTVFEEPERSLFREALGLDAAAWERGRGWAFEMAIGGLHYYEETNPVFARQAARTLARLMDDGAASGLGGAGGVR